MVTTTEEQQIEAVEGRTIGERMAAVEGKQDVFVDVLHENGRRSDENYRALDAKIDALGTKFDTKIDALDARINARIDRLMYFMLGIGGAVLVGIVIQLVS